MKQPWLNEPNRVEFKYKGFDCLIVRNNSGALCGYAAMKPGHPWYEKHYNSLQDVEVHGGVTYTDHCQGIICHKTDKEDNVWWIGFDCAHAYDLIPEFTRSNIFRELLGDAASSSYGTYKDISFVTKEIEKLVDQAIEVDVDPWLKQLKMREEKE